MYRWMSSSWHSNGGMEWRVRVPSLLVHLIPIIKVPAYSTPIPKSLTNNRWVNGVRDGGERGGERGRGDGTYECDSEMEERRFFYSTRMTTRWQNILQRTNLTHVLSLTTSMNMSNGRITISNGRGREGGSRDVREIEVRRKCEVAN